MVMVRPLPALLDMTLRRVARRYRLPPFDDTSAAVHESPPATTLAIAIERARRARLRGKLPNDGLKRVFCEALAKLIREAMRADGGDSAFQAMVLRHRAASVREYASLIAHAERDRRTIHATVNAIAHPAKQERIPPGANREALARLHGLTASASWAALHDHAQRLLEKHCSVGETPADRELAELRDSRALARLRRLDELASNELVRQYQSLRNGSGPPSGSPAAVANGAASQERGAAVEASAAHAVEALARRLNDAEHASAQHRIVTSLRVPASLPASHDRAKTEWDVVLLRQSKVDGPTSSWEVCLLVEAKASVDAAATDLPRLLRGLQLLGHAEDNVDYAFDSKQGTVHLRGASLRALSTEQADLFRTVLYCCDAPAETTPRLLSAASRMQLLSAEASLEFASTLARGQNADPEDFGSVWEQLLEAPRWHAVLHQYPTLSLARELMVNIDDLLAAT